MKRSPNSNKIQVTRNKNSMPIIFNIAELVKILIKNQINKKNRRKNNTINKIRKINKNPK